MTKKEKVDLSGVYGQRDFEVGDKVKITAEVAGMAPGFVGEITEVRYDGCLFRLDMVNGPKNGQNIMIKAADLADKKEKEKKK